MTSDLITQLVQEHYALKVQAEPLPGYEELNFLLTTAGGTRYILKVSGREAGSGLIAAQYDMLSHLHREMPGDYFPEFVPNTEGGYLTHFEDGNGSPGTIRILTFLPGEFIGNLDSRPAGIYEDFGRFLGEMDRALAGFKHQGAHRRFKWDLQYALDAEKGLLHIKDHDKRRLAAYFLLQFETIVLPLIPELRHAVIHNDANDQNVLTQNGKITGLIDFGDVTYSPVINNLAVALAYALLDEKEPLETAARMIKGYHSRYKLTRTEVGLLYYLIAARLSVSVILSAEKKAKGSGNEHHFHSEKPAWHFLNRWIQINPVKAELQFLKACGFGSDIQDDPGRRQLFKDRKTYIGRNLSLGYRNKLKIVKGGLQYLYDDVGNTYLDCINNVSHVGHNHPVVVKALQKQIALLNTNTRYLHDGIIDYAKRLTATLPDKLKVCYFSNSGSEANDLAVRMARLFTGQKDLIVLDHAYHGTSTTAVEMSPYKFDGKGGFPKPEYVHKAENPDTYRGRFSGPDAGRNYAESVNRIIQKLSAGGKKPAAFICETLLGVGGQIPLPEGYLAQVYRLVREAGGVCIADEVQVGFGRVGRAFWGFELQQAAPDIVVMGKPAGNGHPLAVTVVTEEIAEAFDNGMEYFNTFGGNPVSMQAGLAVLDVIEQEELQKNALAAGNYLLNKLKKLQGKFEIIGDVRGEGLFLGVEFVKNRNTKEPAAAALADVVEEMKDRGFLLSTDGPLNNVLKIKPPVIFSEENADALAGHLEAVLHGLKQ